MSVSVGAGEGTRKGVSGTDGRMWSNLQITVYDHGRRLREGADYHLETIDGGLWLVLTADPTADGSESPIDRYGQNQG